MFGKNECKMEISLEPKDGNNHIFLVHTGISNGNNPEGVYNKKINEILSTIQSKGYEILDIKLEIGGTQGLSYETLIIYR